MATKQQLESLKKARAAKAKSSKTTAKKATRTSLRGTENEVELLKKAIRKDLKDNNCYRDVCFAVLGNFSTEELIDHILTHRMTKQQLVKKII